MMEYENKKEKEQKEKPLNDVCVSELVLAHKIVHLAVSALFLVLMKII